MRLDGRLGRPSAPVKARVFFALWPDEQAAQQLYRVAMERIQKYAGRAMRQDTLHLTLAFLGELSDERLVAARAVADEVMGLSFRMRLDRLGYWSHNRILWAGCMQVDENLSGLANTLLAALRGHGFDVEKRPFVPHVTLARNVDEVGEMLTTMPPIEWQCDRFVLLQSALSSAAGYRQLAGWPLQH